MDRIRIAVVAVAALGVSLLAVQCSPAARPTVASFGPRPSDADILADLNTWDAATSDSRRAAAEEIARRVPDFALLRLETFACGGRTHEIAVFKHGKTGMEFVSVPVGQFVPGSPHADSTSGYARKSARRAVRLSRPFLMARTECTQAAWDKVGGVDQRNWHGHDLPVEMVSRGECDAWCRKAGLSLPTQAQWEYACGTGLDADWCFGDDESLFGDYAWCGANSSLRTHAVGRKRPNAFGLFDVHGNVWEICSDGYDRFGLDTPPSASDDPGGEYMIAGGGFSDHARNSRSAGGIITSYDRMRNLGFRPMRAIPPK